MTDRHLKIFFVYLFIILTAINVISNKGEWNVQLFFYGFVLFLENAPASVMK